MSQSRLVPVFVFLTAVVAASIEVALGQKMKVIHHSITNVNCPYDNIRLPDDIIPVAYLVYLHPNITNGNFQYTGNVKILIAVTKETDLIILHSLRITHLFTAVYQVPLHTSKLTNAYYEEEKIEVKRTIKHKKHEQAMIQLGSKLRTSRKYILEIMFSAALRDELKGFYKSSYKTAKSEEIYLATTHFESTGARLAFPCFDEPAMKAVFSIVMVRERIHTAISNMPIALTRTRDDGLMEDFFLESVNMSTYLIAFVVSDFAHLSTTSKEGIQVRVWAPKDQISQARYALEITPNVLDYYGNFSVKFPLPKLDMIGIPDFGAGAMENWGLITYRLTNILYDEKESNLAAKQYLVETITHELSHQWFGNLVTMKWWEDIWLNEGFANFLMDFGVRLLAPDWGIMDQFVTSYLQPALALDSHAHSHPILVPVKDPADIDALFDSITYDKGSSLIFMLRDFMGHDNFAKGIANYIKKYKYSNVDSDDLWTCLSEAIGDGGINVKQVMDTWTLQVGYPLITVRREGNTAYLTQERFVSDADNGTYSGVADVNNTRWMIPLTFYYEHDSVKRRKWFHTSDDIIRLLYNHSLGWMKMNVDEIGFYRINYDEKNWKDLAEQLMKNHTALSPTDRANLIDDAFQLAWAGRLTQAHALELTEYLTKEKEYVPYKAAAKSLRYVGDMLSSRPGYAAYEKYILQQTLPLVRELGWRDTGTHLEKLLRGIIFQIAVRHNESDSVHKAKVMFNEYMLKGKWIPSNFRESVYYAAIKYGTKKEWNYMFNMYKTTRVPIEKVLLMHSLTYTSDTKLLKKYLEMAFDHDIIRSQDSCTVISDIALNPIGTVMAYNFMKDNWEMIIKRYGTGIDFRNLVELFKAVFGTGKTNGDLAKAEQFFATHELAGGKLAAKQALANIRNHIQWLERNERIVVKWLKTKA